MKALVKEALDQILQAEMTDFLGAAPGERSTRPVADDRTSAKQTVNCSDGRKTREQIGMVF